MSHPRNANDIFNEFFEGSKSPNPVDSGGHRPRNADDKFCEFFGDSKPPNLVYGGGGGAGGGSGGRPRNAEDIFGEFFAFDGGRGSVGGGEGGSSLGSMHHDGARKAEPIEKKLACSLEDLYKGTTKKMKISREIFDVIGKTKQVEEILTVDVKPGWKKGTKITFNEKGNEQPGVIPSDLVFVIDEKPHPVFTREGNDLIVTKKILVVEAFTGYTVNLTTLDGRRLTIPIKNVIHPEYEEVVQKEGMPLQKDRNKKGNLRIKFDIKFPSSLTSEQKTGLKKLLG